MPPWVKVILAGLCLMALGVAVASWWGARRWRENSDELVGRLVHANLPRARVVSFKDFDRLPRPVARYFRTTLREGQPFVRLARFTQSGQLRTSETSDKWSPFEANQTVTPSSPGFIWDARVRAAPLIHVRVRDSYVAGAASGQVSLQSTLPLDQDPGGVELNTGALHRFLAEAVWYPTALLPDAGVQWTPVSDRKALATLADHEISVSLEFRFNDANEVSGVYSPGRYRKTSHGYELTAWEGHFAKYEDRDKLRIPTEGEVGWYLSGEWRPVWQGKVSDMTYEFAD